MLLPLCDLRLSGLQSARRFQFARLRGGEVGCQPLQFLAHIGEFLFVALDMRDDVCQRGSRLRQVGALPLASLARVLDLLFGARDVGANGVEAPLHL